MKTFSFAIVGFLVVACLVSTVATVAWSQAGTANRPDTVVGQAWLPLTDRAGIELVPMEPVPGSRSRSVGARLWVRAERERTWISVGWVSDEPIVQHLN